MSESKTYTAITGASSGIGYMAAKEFARRGKNLIIIARRKDQLDQLKAEIVAQHPMLDVIIEVCDLSVRESVHLLYERLRRFHIETWINNAGFGDYSSVAAQNLDKIHRMIRLNVEALTVLSTLYVRDYIDVAGTQLINVSSRGGYVIVPHATTYCATKFYVSAFTEALAQELKASGAQLQAKVLAPAATKTEFGKVANDVAEYNYDQQFSRYHTVEQMADFLLQLYDSDHSVGLVDWQSFAFSLQSPIFDHAGNSSHNQKPSK